MKAMEEAAETDPAVAQRVKMFRYRAAEELYDLEKDPDCINNLVGKADFEDELNRRRNQLHNWMIETSDPLLPAFENRNSPEKLKSALIDIYGDNYKKAAERQSKAPRNNKKQARKRNK